MSESDDRLRAIAALPDERIDVFDAALWIARGEYPELDLDHVRSLLGALSESARGAVPAEADAIERVARLNRFFYEDQGFRGNESDYYDPRNSYVPQVLERHTGIPITLALVYTMVARGVGLDVRGVGFPGHFLVRHMGEPEILVDPFTGKILTREDCEGKLRELHGEQAILDPELLEPATPRETLVRMLRNLKHVYVKRGDLERALRVATQILIFRPDDAGEVRERGLLWLRLECFSAALGDLERSIELDPRSEASIALRDSLPEIREKAAQLQ